MFCPKCESENVRVVDTMHEPDNKTYRRRKCVDCGMKFRTVETLLENVEGAEAGYSQASMRKSPLLKK